MVSVLFLLPVLFFSACIGPDKSGDVPSVPQQPPAPIEQPAPPAPPVPPTPPPPVPTEPNPMCVDIEILKADKSVYVGCAVSPAEQKKFVLVDVSQVNCGACIQNYPIFVKLAKDIESVANSRTIYLDRDKQMVVDYVKQNPQFFGNEEVGLDVERKQSKLLKIKYTPTMFVLDEKGVILFSSVGVLTSKNIADIKKVVGL